MADVQPLRALHYDLAKVGSLDAVAAPPYDVIDAEQRAGLVARSPYNVVEIDLPQADDGGDPYAHAAELLERWRAEGAVVRDEEPALWALTQFYVAPDGGKHVRRGFFCRVRVEDYGPGRIRPHERTHPGPQGGPPAADPRDARRTSPPSSPCTPTPSRAAWRALEPWLDGRPWGEQTDDDGTVNRLWRVSRPRGDRRRSRPRSPTPSC